MNQTPSFFNEHYLRFIQESLNVSRQEIIETILHTNISAKTIAENIEKFQRKNDGEDGKADATKPTKL